MAIFFRAGKTKFLYNDVNMTVSEQCLDLVLYHFKDDFLKRVWIFSHLVKLFNSLPISVWSNFCKVVLHWKPNSDIYLHPFSEFIIIGVYVSWARMQAGQKLNKCFWCWFYNKNKTDRTFFFHFEQTERTWQKKRNKHNYLFNIHQKNLLAEINMKNQQQLGGFKIPRLEASSKGYALCWWIWCSPKEFLIQLPLQVISDSFAKLNNSKLLICLVHCHSLAFQFNINPLKMFVWKLGILKIFFLSSFSPVSLNKTSCWNVNII